MTPQTSTIAASAISATKEYGSGEDTVYALRDVSVDFYEGQFTAIMGPSGSGKSTLMHCIAGLDELTKGSAISDGTNLSTLKDKELTELRREKIGFVFQSFNLVPTLTANENIRLPLMLGNNKGDEAWIQKVIDTVHLQDRLTHRPSELSGGQQQRVAVARALASQPRIIFADEPTGNLDSITGAEILTFMRKAVDDLGQTIVMVTHDPVAAAYADRIIFLADGHIVNEMTEPTAERVLDLMKSIGHEAVFRIALKGILGRKARLILTSLAVILGTSFLAGTSVFSDTLNRTFDNLFSDVFKNVDAYVRSTQVIEADFGLEERQRITSDLVAIVEKVPGVRDASPDIQAFARIIGKNGKPLGSDGQGPPTFGSIGEEFAGALWTTAEGRWPVSSSEVVIDEASAKAGKYTLGDSVKVVAQSGSRSFTLVGIASYGDVRSPGGATFALFDPVTAAEFLTKPGYIDAILVSGDGSVSDTKLSAAIQAALPATAKTETLTGAEITAETQDQIGSALDFFGILLQTFSFIALGVGCFVIYNVLSISAAQRQRENALLRAIGASRKQITRAMLIEAIVVGLVGSVVGVVAGIGLSSGLSALLRALNIDIPSSGLVVSQSTVTSTIVIGLIVTVLSAILPARRAGKVPPLAAMRATALEIAEPGRKRLYVGLGSIALGLAIIVAVVVGASNTYLGLGILFVFIGTIVLGPIISRPVALFLGRPAAHFSGITGVMARQNSARNPKRTSRTASPVLIGVALVTAVTALAASIKGQINEVSLCNSKVTMQSLLTTNLLAASVRH